MEVHIEMLQRSFFLHFSWPLPKNFGDIPASRFEINVITTYMCIFRSMLYATKYCAFFYSSPWWVILIFWPPWSFLPPWGFSGMAGKRRRAAPPNFAQLFEHQFSTLCWKVDFRSSEVRSPGHFKWPCLPKCLWSYKSRSFYLNGLKLAGFYKIISTYNLCISYFLHRWP